MKWVTTTTPIPFEDKSFNEIVKLFVFECPSVIRKEIKNNERGDAKYITETQPVSARKSVSFKSREITGHYLITILAQIRRPLAKNNAFIIVEQNDNVEDKVNNMIKNTTMSDPYFDLIAMKVSGKMPQTESLFYHIRNAFAHGSFEVKNVGKDKIYFFECSRGKKVNARMRLKESTLYEYIKLSKLTTKQIKELQNNRKK